MSQKKIGLSFYESIKDNKHIFIYSVCGRSSSTAFQRILNSSNEVCIFGESWGVNGMILSLIHTLKKKNSKAWPEAKLYDLNKLKSCFDNNKHDVFYSNAFRSLDNLISEIISGFVNLFQPVNGTDRFGFKEVSVGIETLDQLKEIFHNCFIIFSFRNPLRQWPSVRNLGWFPYSNDLELFLKEYKVSSDVYLNFSEGKKDPLFVEDSNLYHMGRVRHIINLLDISKFDEDLIGLKVSSNSNKGLTSEEKDIILRSEANNNYLRMVNLSNNLFRSC
jgi:hypothetical protein